MTTIYHSVYDDLDVTLIDETQDLGNLVTELYDCDRFALDCESIDLGRNHPISLMNIALEDDSVYLVDLQEVRLSNRLRSLLENDDIKKVMFDCRSDADCLKHQYGVELEGIEDLQIMEYVIQNPDLEAAHFLPSYNEVLHEYQSTEVANHLSRRKPNNMNKWAIRPLKQFLLDYASLEISCFLDIRSDLMEMLPHPYDLVDVQEWSGCYASSRVDLEKFNKDNSYQSHHFMELDILTDANYGDIECTGCGLGLDEEEYSKTQLRKKNQKCIVCKEIKWELDH